MQNKFKKCVDKCGQYMYNEINKRNKETTASKKSEKEILDEKENFKKNQIFKEVNHNRKGGTVHLTVKVVLFIFHKDLKKISC